MTLRTLPEARTIARPQNFQWDAPADVLAAWADAPRAEASSEENTISMFDVIGEDFWTGGGVTAKKVAGILRAVGDGPIRVEINSPGGDVFEGIAIYNLLRKHKGRVAVDVLGWAASAASIIAMAGDEIRMSVGSFIMVHNAWGVVVGNRHDLSEAMDTLESIDGSLMDIYEARTGEKRAEIEKLMDRETWLNASDAVARGFADKVDDTVRNDDGKGAKASAEPEMRQLMARRRAEAAFAKAGFTRADRTDLIKELSATPRDASRPTPAARDAGDFEAGVRQLIQSLKS